MTGVRPRLALGPLERLPSFTHFVVGLLGDEDAREFLSWEQAVAFATAEGHTSVLGVTWDATQILALDGRAAGKAIQL